jgi:hypothetical protein
MTRPNFPNLLAIAAGVMVTLLFRGYQFGESNHTVYLVAALRLEDPTLLAHDWWTTSTLQYHGLFARTAVGLAKAGLLKAGFLTLYLALVVAMHGAWLRLVRHVGGGPAAYLLSVGLYYVSFGGFGLGMYEFLQDGSFLPSNVANVAMLWAVVLVIEGRTIAAAACLGAAGMFHLNHALVGGLGWLMLLPAMRDRPGRWSIGGAVVAALSLVTIRPALAAVMHRTGGMATAAFVDLYVRVRHPHHYDPSTWHWALWVSFLWPVPVAVLVSNEERFRRPIAISAYFLVLVGFALILVGIWYVGETVVQLSLYRFSIYPKLIGCVIAAAWVWRNTTRAKVVAAVVALAVAGFAVARVRDPQLLSRYNPRDDADYLRVCDWVREHTPKHAVLLVPPGEQSMRLRGRRAIVVNFKGVPQLSSELEEWKERMEAVARISDWRPLMGRFDFAMRQVDRRYDALPADYLLGVADVYDADHVVARRGIPEFGQPLFTSGPYRLYALKRVRLARQ